MSREKIKTVSKYLRHKDVKLRGKALKKLEAYLSRGYDRNLIDNELKKFISVEKNEKLLSFARQLCEEHHAGTQKGTSRKRFYKIAAVLAGVFGLIILVLVLIPSEDKKGASTDASADKVADIGDSSAMMNKGKTGDTPEAIDVELSAAEGINIEPLKKFDDTQPLDREVKLRFSPGRRKTYKSRVKIVQKMGSSGRIISQKEVSFILKKKVLMRRKNSVTISVSVDGVKGSTSPSFLGFPAPGKEVIFDIAGNFSVRKIRLKKRSRGSASGSISYTLPFPQYSDDFVKTGSRWGNNLKTENFAVNSSYHFDGKVPLSGSKSVFKISFLSASESRSRTSTFHVDRKGVFYVGSRTGIPQYLKLHTISKTKLKGSGFPVENEVVIEETLL